MTDLTPKAFRAMLDELPPEQAYYRTPFKKDVVYTEGVRLLMEHGSAHWLVDAIISYYGTPQMRAAIEKDERLVFLHYWTLSVAEDRSAELVLRADAGVDPAIGQTFTGADFPLDSVEIWATRNADTWVIHMPCEW